MRHVGVFILKVQILLTNMIFTVVKIRQSITTSKNKFKDSAVKIESIHYLNAYSDTR